MTESKNTLEVELRPVEGVCGEGVSFIQDDMILVYSVKYKLDSSKLLISRTNVRI